MASTFQPNIPTGSVKLSLDYANIQGNFQQLDTSFGVDHTPFSVDITGEPAGYHSSIHFTPVSTTATNPPNNNPIDDVPTVTPGFGQLFSAQTNDGFLADTSLFLLTGTGLVSKLTSNFSPVASTNGYTYLPGPLSGGVVLQWGIVNGTHGVNGSFNNSDKGTVTFSVSNKSFPNNCFGVWAGVLYNTAVDVSPSSAANISIDLNTLSNLKFDWVFSTDSARYYRFFWVALGN